MTREILSGSDGADCMRKMLSPKEAAELRTAMMQQVNCLPFQISRQDFEDFYLGFCNEAIWPLFHYFCQPGPL